MTFTEKMADKNVKVKPSPKRTEPLWRGPHEDGVTFSLLSRFLVCRERFRLHVIEGLRPAYTFNHRIEYGQLWHTCEEALAAKLPWEPRLKEYCVSLVKAYPNQGEQVDHWYRVCKAQFPLYIAYWAKQKDVTTRTPLVQEEVFSIPYTLPSGRVVRLRGKWDANDLIGKGPSAGIYVFETKTKGDIHEGIMKRQLSFDLQTMIYVVAATQDTGIEALEEAKEKYPIKGVRYNVVRRPLSGGKGTIVRHKPSKSNPAGESKDEYYARLAAYIREEPETYFMRWRVELLPQDITRFRRECLDPILEQLCDWWDWVGKHQQEPFDVSGHGGIHWRSSFGVYNSLLEGGSTDLDEFLATRNETGLIRVEKLFTELE